MQLVNGNFKNAIVVEINIILLLPANSSGSLVVQTTLSLDLDDLETMVKKRGFVPSKESIVTMIERVIAATGDDVTVEFVRKEPEFREFYITISTYSKLFLHQSHVSL